MFRPQRMTWVDLLIDRDSVQEAIQILATRSIIELRSYSRHDQPFEVEAQGELAGRLDVLEQKLNRYRRYVPRLAVSAMQRAGPLQPTARELPLIEQRVQAWVARIAQLAAQLEDAESRREDYAALRRCIVTLPASGYDLGYFVTLSRSKLYSSFIALGTRRDAGFFRDAERVLFDAYPVGDDAEACVYIGVVSTDDLAELERAGHARGIRFFTIPSQIHGPSPEAASQLQSLIDEADAESEGLRGEIERISEEMDIASLAWKLRRHAWTNQVLQAALTGRRFVWLGGWIAEPRYAELLEALETAHVPFLVNRADPDEHGPPPALLDNPRWMQRFEVFARGFGMPAQNDVDPTPLLAVTTPLMFGYMFGDVGHGLVLCIVGWSLRRRVPVLSLLLPAGLASILFGFLFGSVFCSEALLPALWLHPLAQPLTILGVPLVFGFVFLSVAMLLSAIQASWHAEARSWWREGFPVLVLYTLSLPLLLWSWRIAALTALGAIAWQLGASAIAGFRNHAIAGAFTHASRSLLELLELLTQLLINTLSFARLGAFALAHAGLSSAVITLAELPGSTVGIALVLVLGNVLVIALEGLVVSIQTTRLVMFEFFRRFYTGEGRVFRPLSLPPNGAH